MDDLVLVLVIIIDMDSVLDNRQVIEAGRILHCLTFRICLTEFPLAIIDIYR